MIASTRGMLKSYGIRQPACSTAAFYKKAHVELEECPQIAPGIQPMLDPLQSLGNHVKKYDAHIQGAAANRYPGAVHLSQIPSVGPITSLMFVLTIEDPKRFEKSPRDVGAFLGMVPGRDLSGNRDRSLSISKSGNTYLRKLLVQSARYMLGPFGPDCALRRHGLKLMKRGGAAGKKRPPLPSANWRCL